MNPRYLGRVARTGLLLSSLLAFACGDGEDGDGAVESACFTPAAGEIEIAGDWVSNFDAVESISSDSWGDAAVTQFDNDDNVAITQNPDDAQFSPGAFNRIVWTEPSECTFYYCTVAFGLETEDEALESTATADDTDPETGGCGESFPWTKLSVE